MEIFTTTFGENVQYLLEKSNSWHIKCLKVLIRCIRMILLIEILSLEYV